MPVVHYSSYMINFMFSSLNPDDRGSQLIEKCIYFKLKQSLPLWSEWSKLNMKLFCFSDANSICHKKKQPRARWVYLLRWTPYTTNIFYYQKLLRSTEHFGFINDWFPIDVYDVCEVLASLRQISSYFIQSVRHIIINFCSEALFVKPYISQRKFVGTNWIFSVVIA